MTRTQRAVAQGERTMLMLKKQTAMNKPRISLARRLQREWQMNKWVYVIAIPVLIYYITFCYAPMYGAQIAFKNYKPGRGIWGSKWVGLMHFETFFNGIYFARTLRNTLTISLTSLAVEFPAAIILALLLNEVRNERFKRVIQTVSYLPHFISLVVVCSIVREFTNSTGLINDIIELFGGTRQTLLLNGKAFVPIYVISGVWQHVGWNCIVYLAALSGIDPTLYEAAVVDGASRWHRLIHITLPGIAPTIIILLIMRVGQVMSVGHEKIILLYNDYILEYADVISTYIYRKGLLEMNYSFSAAVGLFNSVINFALVMAVNALARRISDTSLW